MKLLDPLGRLGRETAGSVQFPIEEGREEGILSQHLGVKKKVHAEQSQRNRGRSNTIYTIRTALPVHAACSSARSLAWPGRGNQHLQHQPRLQLQLAACR